MKIRFITLKIIEHLIILVLSPIIIPILLLPIGTEMNNKTITAKEVLRSIFDIRIWLKD